MVMVLAEAAKQDPPGTANSFTNPLAHGLGLNTCLRYPTGQSCAECGINALHIAQDLIPNKTKISLEKEGIDIGKLSELTTKKSPKGTLIEIETAKEKLIISIE